MNIAIIGAGIYGCHLALRLKTNDNNIDLYERCNDIFTGASWCNSHRIHKGYHYPRSGKTRKMCKKNEAEFIRHYSHIISQPKNNAKIFCIADDGRSLLDYITMKTIMQETGLPFEEIPLEELKRMGFRNIEGGFRAHEGVFLVDKAKSWFRSALIEKGIHLKLNCPVDKIDSIGPSRIAICGCAYDLVINCTYNQALQYTSTRYPHYFDLCFYLVIASKKNTSEVHTNSFAIFDGKYPSLEPFGYSSLPERYSGYCDRRLLQVFHVKHTSLGKYTDIDKARRALEAGLSTSELSTATNRLLNDTMHFYPSLLDEFKVIDHNLVLKTKVTDLSDLRPLLVLRDLSRHRRLIQVFSSKLTSIISAEREVKKIIGEEVGRPGFVPQPSLPTRPVVYPRYH